MASWLFFRVARSLRIKSDMLVAHALKNSQLTDGESHAIYGTGHWDGPGRIGGRASRAAGVGNCGAHHRPGRIGHIGTHGTNVAMRLRNDELRTANRELLTPKKR